jgi:hypothetical protein
MEKEKLSNGSMRASEGQERNAGVVPPPWHKKLTVVSRWAAGKYCEQAHEESSIIISISSPYLHYDNDIYQSEENKVVSILPLAFFDAEEGDDIMTEADAEKIKEFLLEYPNYDIIVHCDAGVSRSAGVGAAILRWLTGDDDYIFDSGKFFPNMHCYRMTLNALMGSMI